MQTISNDFFIHLCRDHVVLSENGRGFKTSDDDVFVVWQCKTLQNHKALLSTKVKGARYYECTYNGDKGELYVDEYEKARHTAWPVMLESQG